MGHEEASLTRIRVLAEGSSVVLPAELGLADGSADVPHFATRDGCSIPALFGASR
jgi:hypothetical protein